MTLYLLDTNVVSELIKKQPNPHVISWISAIPMYHFSISVLTLGEIRKGVEKIDDIARRQKMIQWLEIDLCREFSGRIIEIDAAVADKWGHISAVSPVAAIDGLMGASALVHNQKIVTRNVKDFKSIQGLEIINPWDM
jgi:predicted nucleic acid-binding protein